jgi:hypothetical protein
MNAIARTKLEPRPGLDVALVSADNAGVHQVLLKLQFLGFAAGKVGAEIHVPLGDVLLIVSEHRERFAVRAASDDQVTRICLDATDVLEEILNWGPQGPRTVCRSQKDGSNADQVAPRRGA